MISFHTGQDDELAYYTILENMVFYKHFSDSIRLRQHPGDHQTGKYHHLVALIYPWSQSAKFAETPCIVLII